LILVVVFLNWLDIVVFSKNKKIVEKRLRAEALGNKVRENIKKYKEKDAKRRMKYEPIIRIKVLLMINF
jgi:hypothetical protein